MRLRRTVRHIELRLGKGRVRRFSQRDLCVFVPEVGYKVEVRAGSRHGLPGKHPFQRMCEVKRVEYQEWYGGGPWNEPFHDIYLKPLYPSVAKPALKHFLNNAAGKDGYGWTEVKNRQRGTH